MTTAYLPVLNQISVLNMDGELSLPQTKQVFSHLEHFGSISWPEYTSLILVYLYTYCSNTSTALILAYFSLGVGSRKMH